MLSPKRLTGLRKVASTQDMTENDRVIHEFCDVFRNYVASSVIAAFFGSKSFQIAAHSQPRAVELRG